MIFLFPERKRFTNGRDDSSIELEGMLEELRAQETRVAPEFVQKQDSLFGLYIRPHFEDSYYDEQDYSSFLTRSETALSKRSIFSNHSGSSHRDFTFQKQHASASWIRRKSTELTVKTVKTFTDKSDSSKSSGDKSSTMNLFQLYFRGTNRKRGKPKTVTVPDDSVDVNDTESLPFIPAIKPQYSVSDSAMLSLKTRLYSNIPGSRTSPYDVKAIFVRGKKGPDDIKVIYKKANSPTTSLSDCTLSKSTTTSNATSSCSSSSSGEIWKDKHLRYNNKTPPIITSDELKEADKVKSILRVKQFLSSNESLADSNVSPYKSVSFKRNVTVKPLPPLYNVSSFADYSGSAGDLINVMFGNASTYSSESSPDNHKNRTYQSKCNFEKRKEKK